MTVELRIGAAGKKLDDAKVVGKRQTTRWWQLSPINHE